MSGKLVPVVYFPRFVTVQGPLAFPAFPIDVRKYSKAIVDGWRGPVADTGSPTFSFDFQESVDRVDWKSIGGFDPGSGMEDQVELGLTYRWFRPVIKLTGTNPIVTVWLQGFFELREE